MRLRLRIFFLSLLFLSFSVFFFFFFNDTATTEIYTLSLHDALPIFLIESVSVSYGKATAYLPVIELLRSYFRIESRDRSEEHTSELQSPCNLVCRLLLEKKKKKDRRRAEKNLDNYRERRHQRRPYNA